MASGVSMVSFPLPQSSACARFHTAKSVSVMPLDSRMRWSCLSSAARFGASLAICPSALMRSEEHTSELQSLMRISYAVFCLKNKNKQCVYDHTPPQQIDTQAYHIERDT